MPQVITKALSSLPTASARGIDSWGETFPLSLLVKFLIFLGIGGFFLSSYYVDHPIDRVEAATFSTVPGTSPMPDWAQF